MKTKSDHKEQPIRRVVITGMGAITPIGMNVADFWSALMQQKVGFTELDAFDTSEFKVKLAAQVREFDPADYMERKEIRRMDRFCHFTVAASEEAVKQSGLDIDQEDPFRIGTIYGTGVGGISTLEDQFSVLHEKGPGRISPLFIPMMIGNMASGTLSMKYKTRGSSACISSACSTGTHAIGEAFHMIRYGQLDACICGGAEAPITPIAVGGFSNMKTLALSEDPNRISIPFDKERSGFVIGEGAGTLILEELEHAKKRNAVIYGEICGYGSTSDAYHITSPDPEGTSAAMCMQLAVEEAGLELSDIGYINAHGTSTELNDKYETLAIKRCFGDHADKLAISSTKSSTGHLLGAAGAVETIATALALSAGILPATVGYKVPDPECDLDYITEGPRKSDCTAAITNSLGFGGHNATLCLKRYSE